MYSNYLASAEDADSEGEEGKFYVWTFDEFREIAGQDFSLLAEYYDVTKQGNWEEGKNALRLTQTRKGLLGRIDSFKTAAQQSRFTFKALSRVPLTVLPSI